MTVVGQRTPERFIGLDIGAETIKLVELTSRNGELKCSGQARVEHHKAPGPALLRLLENWRWEGLAGAAACGRLSRQLALPRVRLPWLRLPDCAGCAAAGRPPWSPSAGTASRSWSFATAVLRCSGRTPAAPRAPATSCVSWWDAST